MTDAHDWWEICKFSQEERVAIVHFLPISGENASEVRRRFMKKFPGKTVSAQTVFSINTRFNETVSVDDVHVCNNAPELSWGALSITDSDKHVSKWKHSVPRKFLISHVFLSNKFGIIL